MQEQGAERAARTVAMGQGDYNIEGSLCGCREITLGGTVFAARKIFCTVAAAAM